MKTADPARILAPLGRGMRRLFGRGAEAAPGPEGLRDIIALHSGADVERRDERAMLRSVLELDRVEVAQVMHHRKDLVAIDADLPVRAIVEQIVASPYTRIPLWRGEPDNIVGVLHAKAVLRQVWANLDHPEAVDIASMAAEPWFIPESTTLLSQLRAFRRRREHFALVVDEYGSLLGVVTLEDILEEIVGEIADEHDVVRAGVRALRDGSYIVEGTVTVRELNRLYEWSLPETHAATIAGLVIHAAKIIPTVNQTFIFHGFRLEVLRRQRNQITLLRVRPPTVAAAVGAAGQIS
ncbi:MAG: CBS domain-containing protein [Alphaproteobacteria bacterium]|nr:CBS domain-containing protein [Alphaproteobacteria bacterium]